MTAGLLFQACRGNNGEPSIEEAFTLDEIVIDGKSNQSSYTDLNPGEVGIKLKFSLPVDKQTVTGNVLLRHKSGKNEALVISYDSEATLNVKPASALSSFATYELIIQPAIKSQSNVVLLTGKTYPLTTGMDMTDKFPRIPDEELLDLVQSQTFKYFWGFGHPVSGMARERTTSGNTVTTGGTGFGVMAMIVAAERGFVSRQEALERIDRIVTFLDTQCTTYHGAFAHWINGNTGATVAFSQYDDGADLVETALLMQGLLTARQYFDAPDSGETALRQTITRLWEAVEWTWFCREGDNALYWHWSPTYGWQMGMKITGWNEALIAYVLAASSPTFPLAKEVYEQGWTQNGGFTNGSTYQGYRLPLGPDYGGPLFFSHYSFLGIHPKQVSDSYTDYWTQNRNHTLINYSYCVENPKRYDGYGADCWGLTASDGDKGYSAHSPTNDRGVIAPTAALSSMPYTPGESMQALHFFYYKLGDKLWSDYGFYDAFNLTEQWFDDQHIAIDQGPIVVMIENYRTGLIWELFMSDTEIRTGLNKLGFNLVTTI